MTFDKFLRRNRLIAEHLAQIAQTRKSEGWIDDGRPDSALREVLAAQERLLTAAERLLDSCIDTVSSSSSAMRETLRVLATPGFATDSH